MAKEKTSKAKKNDLKKEKKVKKTKSSSKTVSKTSTKTTKAAKGRRPKSTLVPVTEKFTQNSLNEYLAVETGIEKKDVKKVITALNNAILGSLVKKGRGEFIYPTMFKVVTQHKAATKKRKGTNPFTGEPCIFKAKPATTVVKVRPLIKLKRAARNEI